MPRGHIFDQGLRARELFDKGLSCNRIAKELGVSPSTISTWARREGLSFARATPAMANQARSVDLKARRQALVQRLYARAEKNMTRLEAAKYSYRVTFADYSQTVEDSEPPAADELRHSQAVGNYLKTAAQLEAVDADGGASEARSMLVELGRALGLAPADS